MRKSKYLGMKSEDWFCSHVGVARVQPVLTKKKGLDGKRIKAKYPGHQSYYYIFERLTSDAKAMKMIRLSASQANRVYKGLATVEDFAKKKAAEKSQTFINKVSYSFC